MALVKRFGALCGLAILAGVICLALVTGFSQGSMLADWTDPGVPDARYSVGANPAAPVQVADWTDPGVPDVVVQSPA